MNIKGVNATGKYVVLEGVECSEEQKEQKTAGGIIMMPTEQKSGTKINKVNHDGKIRVKLIVKSVGPDVDLSKYGFKIGDEVIANDLDLQTFGGDDGKIFAVCKADSVKCVIEAE